MLGKIPYLVSNKPFLLGPILSEQCPTPQVSHSILEKAPEHPGTWENWSSLAATCTSACIAMEPTSSRPCAGNVRNRQTQGTRRTALAGNLSLSPGMLQWDLLLPFLH